MPGKFNLDDYVTVNTRIAGFYEKWPDGAIRTVLLSEPCAKTVVFRAEAYRDYHDVENPVSVGHAHEIEGVGMVNQTSAMENCETSAVGRALAMAGFEVTKGVASREEMAAAEKRFEYTNARQPQPQTPQNFSPKSGSTSDGEIMPWGKYKGKPITEIDDNYLSWLINTKLTGDALTDPKFGAGNKALLTALEAELERRLADHAADMFGAAEVQGDPA